MVWGVDGILYAQPLADVLTAALTALMALRVHRELAAEAKARV